MSQGSERVLILTPFGRDAILIQRVLGEQQIDAAICSDIDSFCQEITAGAGALLIGDEVLNARNIQTLGAILKGQPDWSDISLLVMTSGGDATRASSAHRPRLLEPIQGPTTLLERPLRAATLLSTVRSALRARRRQYQVRDLLEEQKKSALALSAANEAFSRSNHSLAEFAYVASHDLKEPLRTMASYTELLRRQYSDRLDQQANHYIDVVISAASRMSLLIEDLLDYSQVTQKGSSSGLHADCAAVVSVVKENLNALIEETSAEITVSELPAVAVEFRQMVQLLQNLIGNALKYRKLELPPQVRVKAEREASLWLFEVSDNGIGFDQAYAEQIFGVFKRLHRNDEAGTGIGLAICRRIVEHYGGTIWAQSCVGYGTSFFFRLPAVGRS